MVALDELWSVSDSSGDQVSLMDTIEDPSAPDPAKALDVGDLKDRIAESIAKLPEREKLVIALYYYENLTLREIGEVLGVTESRVSQMHTKAVLRLRSRMQEESFDGLSRNPVLVTATPGARLLQSLRAGYRYPDLDGHPHDRHLHARCRLRRVRAPAAAR